MSQNESPLAPDNRGALDKLGIGLAGLCAVHCVATILVVSSLGLGGHFLLAPEIHHIGLGVAIIVAALALGWGALRHRRKAPLVIAGIGLGFMAAALIVPHGVGEFVLTLIGVGIVSLGHWMNLRASRS